MTIIAIRKKLVDYMQEADEKKIKAMYALFHDEIEQQEIEYTPAFKKELDNRHSFYHNAGKMISAREVDKQVSKIFNSSRKK